MQKILNYQILEQIYASERTTIYRAYVESSKKLVILKLPNHLYPNLKQLAQYRSAYTLIKDLNFPGIVKMLALEKFEQRLILVMEDFGGISLYQYLSNQDTSSLNIIPLEISDFFHIALQIVNPLKKLHNHQIIHKDIKPQNIIINPHTKRIQIIDFSSITKLPKEKVEVRNPNTWEGTLAYISPEQTGRMNRGIDFRSDLYSLGVTFYQLLTGQLPFTSEDPMELVHCHIAKIPQPIIDINFNIPKPLNDIVLKLMAKMPEERYQSLKGLGHDLKKCQYEWKNNRQIGLFDLGTKDRSKSLMISEKIYGRDRELEKLLTAFDRVSDQEKPQSELMLLGGFSGIGKSVLVNEIHKPIVEKRGYFIAGKFDQFQRNIPFLAWLNAFAELIKQILSEPEAKLQAIAIKLQQVLGEEAQ
ncbi:protein kinase, partial [Okeania sp.]|uniref:protein kinase domain-containing protein n=1 Tax=Okeania sp. TaxID=3100323 RepID=UPI002B4B792F